MFDRFRGWLCGDSRFEYLKTCLNQALRDNAILQKKHEDLLNMITELRNEYLEKSQIKNEKGISKPDTGSSVKSNTDDNNSSSKAKASGNKKEIYEKVKSQDKKKKG